MTTDFGVLAGTASFTSGAANYTTGYATEAAAIAALPAQSAAMKTVTRIERIETTTATIIAMTMTAMMIPNHVVVAIVIVDVIATEIVKIVANQLSTKMMYCFQLVAC